ncbi:hypothetical protein ACH5RR_015959 [Cinchona calisaya]|uniref:Uncharacterized protein n=1 Tax=Cinchona calisaya TaxID=153742 RepID=A0ABD2ZY10_9GENT
MDDHITAPRPLAATQVHKEAISATPQVIPATSSTVEPFQNPCTVVGVDGQSRGTMIDVSPLAPNLFAIDTTKNKNMTEFLGGYVSTPIIINSNDSNTINDNNGFDEVDDLGMTSDIVVSPL